MYHIEIERTWKGKEKQTVVRLYGPRDRETPLAETVYLGDPPGLHLEDGTGFTALRLHANQES